jgi:O-antigen/teichoic acid export membrane protein
MRGRLVADRGSLDLLRESAGALFVKMVGTALSLGFYVLVSRQLGKEQSGEFFLSMTLTIIVATLARWGLDNAVTRHAATAQASGCRATLSFSLKYSLRLVAVISILLTVLLLVAAKPLARYAFHKPNLYHSLQLTAISILPLALYTIQFQFLQGLGQIRSAMLLISFWPQLFMLLPAYFVVKEYGVYGAIFSYACGCAVTVIIGFLYTKPIMGGVSSEQAGTRQELLSGCNALFLASASELLINWVPVVLIGMYSTTREVAEFSVAQRLSMLLAFFFYAVNTTAAAKIATNFRLNRLDVVGNIIRRSSLIMTLGAAPVFLAFTIFPTFVLRSFGEGFITGAGILIVLSIGQMVNVMTGPVASALVMCGKEHIYSKLQICSAIACCALVLLGLHWRGAFGAAIGVAVAIGLKNILCSFFAWTSLKVPPSCTNPTDTQEAIAVGKRIVLVGYYGSNFGDLIMLKGLLDFWRAKGARVTVFTYGTIGPATMEIVGKSKIYPLTGSGKLKPLRSFVLESSRADAVVWGGGTCFMDEGGEGAIKYFLLAKLVGAKVYYLGIGIGNAKLLTTQLYLRLAKVLSRGIVVRDEESAEKLGGTSETVTITPDLAFAFDLRMHIEVGGSQTNLLIAYRNLDKYVSPKRARKLLDQFCDRIVELSRNEAYPLVKVLDTDSDVDVNDGDYIFERLKREGVPATRIKETSALRKLRHIAASSAIVTGRLHVGIFAADLGKPFLVLNCSPKIESFARATGRLGALIAYSDLCEPNIFTRRFRQEDEYHAAAGEHKEEVIQKLELLYDSF